MKQRKKAYKQELISNLHDALNIDPQTVWNMLRKLKDAENIQGESKCQVSATKWVNHLENFIHADLNVSYERKRQVETELIDAINGKTSTFLDRPATNPG